MQMRMSQLLNRCYRLRRRPERSVTEMDLEFLEEPVPTIRPNQALCRTLWLSLDPANRIWMSDVGYYMPPVPIDGVMRGIGIGEVIESHRKDMKSGDLVFGLTGWQDYAIVDEATNELPFTILPTPLPESLTTWLGPLGHTGITAYLGVQDIGRPQPGETMVVSSAAGAVGSVAGQIGLARGARVIGIAGSRQKCRYVTDTLGFAACVNYKDADWREQLDAAAPDGIDIDFENVGGQILDHILARLNTGGRIILCGMISEYETYTAQTFRQRPFDVGQILAKRALMQSFLVLDHAGRFDEARECLRGLIAEGKLRYHETVIEGLERARETFNGLFDGSNAGKTLIKVAEPSGKKTGTF
jgi:NADPH-dependent curcumin reductase CurA